MTILRYALVNFFGTEGTHEFDSLADAKAVATEGGSGLMAIIERTYTFEDSELIWTPDGGDVWPPEGTNV